MNFLTKGQQAMALAMLFPDPEKSGRGKKSEARNLAESAKFSYRRLNEARSVLAFSRPVAEAVLKGTESLEKNKAGRDRRTASEPRRRLAVELEAVRAG